MLHRTNIRLTNEQYEAAVKAASDKGVSLAGYIRNLISTDLRLPGGGRVFSIPVSSNGSYGGYDVTISNVVVKAALDLIHGGGFIGAIKHLRQTQGLSLFDAKGVADVLRKEVDDEGGN
jgi:hypothetical protein